MKTVITGGCGFIGSHVVDEALKRGHEITVIDNLSTGRLENLAHLKNNVKIVKADISQPGNWIDQLSHTDNLIHLAALADIVPSIQNPDAYFHSNVLGTLNVLQASHKAGIKRFIYAASSSCYGITKQHPTPETEPIQPEYPYALTKRLGEELVLHWAKVYKLPSLSLRFFNVYGPRSRTSGTYGAVFGVFLAQKIANKPYTVIGNGKQSRDFTYVTDIAKAVMTAIESNKTAEVYNIGSGASISINRITELLGGNRIYIPKRPGEPEMTFADISKIKRELGWNPEVSIDQGIGLLLENIDYWNNAPVWEPDSIAEQTKDWFRYLG